jgi:predicted lipoprotein with Yx(FWY)xxD motif
MRRRMLGFVVVCALGAVTVGAIAPAGAAVSKPGAPGKPVAVGGNKQAKVSWKAPSNGGSAITLYIVTPYLGAKAQPARQFHSNKTTEVVTGLTNGKAYTFRVAAHNAKGTGKQSVASAAVTIGVPGAPANVSAFAGNAQATVTWSAANGSGSAITGYIVTPFIGSAAQSSKTFASNATSEAVIGLTNGKSYAFRVRARTAAGIGANSSLSPSVKPTSAPAISVAHNAMLNEDILVNASGLTLYLFPPDGAGALTKAGSLLGTWPEAGWSGTVTVGTGLDSNKATVAAQHDGTPMLSYNGHLLYTFVYDFVPGSESNAEEGFYVVTPAGSPG